jgi:hypothetical protein
MTGIEEGEGAAYRVHVSTAGQEEMDGSEEEDAIVCCSIVW